MAASDVEVVNIIRVRVDSVGGVYLPTDKGRTIGQNLSFGDDFRIQPDDSVPETAGYPTLKAYLKLMASRSTPQYPVVITQSMVVTSKH
jgi:hypothetical protein